jgi:hypothetical protein
VQGLLQLPIRTRPAVLKGEVLIDKLGEGEARECVAETLGVTVLPHDDGSRVSMVDALFRYPDGRTAALEIVADVDPVLAMHQAHVRSRGTIRAPSLKLRWALAPHPHYRTNRYESSWVQGLSELESAGCTSLVDGPPLIVSQLRDAGVQYAYAIRGAQGGFVELREALSGGLAPDRAMDDASSCAGPGRWDPRAPVAVSGCRYRRRVEQDHGAVGRPPSVDGEASSEFLPVRAWVFTA